MNLKLVERTSQRGSATFAKVSVSPKGTFYINKLAMEKMKVGDNQKFQVFQDEDDNQKWFFHITPKGYCSIAPKSKNDGSGQAMMADIAQRIVKSFHHEGTKSLKFKLKDSVTFEANKFYPLEVIKESINMTIPNPNGAAKTL